MKACIFIIVLGLLAGCSTKYQAYSASPFKFGGYQDKQLAEDLYEVKFMAREFNNKQKSLGYALLRCAEVAKDHGYDYFIIIDKSYSRTSPGVSLTIKTFKEKPDSDPYIVADDLLASFLN